MPADQAVPVFIFLDEGVPLYLEEIIGAWPQKPAGYHLQVISFPTSFRNLGFFDSQVVLFIKERIFSRKHKIYPLLFRQPGPVFIFLTNDGDFIEDAKKGFQQLAKPVKAKEGVKLNPGSIEFKRAEGTIKINLFFIKIQGRKNQLIRQTLKILKDFLR